PRKSLDAGNDRRPGLSAGPDLLPRRSWDHLALDVRQRRFKRTGRLWPAGRCDGADRDDETFGERRNMNGGRSARCRFEGHDLAVARTPRDAWKLEASILLNGHFVNSPDSRDGGFPRLAPRP